MSMSLPGDFHAGQSLSNDAHGPQRDACDKDNGQVNERELVDVIVGIEPAIVVRKIFLQEGLCLRHAITLIASVLKRLCFLFAIYILETSLLAAL
jgi:hypothetical protein